MAKHFNTQDVYTVLYEIMTGIENSRSDFGPYYCCDFKPSAAIINQGSVQNIINTATHNYGDDGTNRIAMMTVIMACNEYANAMSLLMLAAFDDDTYQLVADELLRVRGANTQPILDYVASTLRNQYMRKRTGHGEILERRLANLTLFFEDHPVFDSIGLSGPTLRNLIDSRIKSDLKQIVKSAMKGAM